MRAAGVHQMCEPKVSIANVLGLGENRKLWVGFGGLLFVLLFGETKSNKEKN